MMPLNHKGYWIPCNVNDALERSYFCMMRGRFCSHHMPIMLLFFLSNDTKNQREDLHVIVCPSVWLGLTMVKFSYSLVWHRETAVYAVK